MDIRSIKKIVQEAEKKDSGYCDPAKDSCNASIQLGNNRNGFFITSTFRNDIPILPSTKLTAAMAVVLTWMHEAPEDKILSKFAELDIIFRMMSTYSSFTSSLQFSPSLGVRPGCWGICFGLWKLGSCIF